MIKHLRQQFVLITMALTSGLVLLLFGLSNYYDHYWNEVDTHRLVKLVAQNGYLKSSADEMIALVTIDNLEEVHIARNDTELTNQEVKSISQSLVKRGKKSRKWKHYIYHLVEQADGSWSLAFIDMTSYDNSLEQNLLIGVFSLLGFGLLLGLSLYLSRFIVEPAQAALDREKQFVSDASHELKTPVAAIRANAQVLQNQIAPNRYLDHILSETKRMELLVQKLLGLSRLDDGHEKSRLVRVNLSAICEEILLSYESLAYEEGKMIEAKITDNLFILGQEEQLKQLLAILLDNAIKYSKDKSTIGLELRAHKRKVLLTISNPSLEYPPEVLERLFERFYQTEQSRSRQDSFGLGLSIAQSLVKRQGGQIAVEQKDGILSFVVHFPLKK